jgi:hypothetical protein
VSGCPFNDELREFLSAHFWLPFAKHATDFEKPNVRRISAPFAGMMDTEGDSPLERLRGAYQEIPPLFDYPESSSLDPTAARAAVTAARADPSLNRKEREEVDLIDAKIDLRAGERGNDAILESAKSKLETFLHSARTQEFRSEARGWLARVYYLQGNQTAAGKIYLDELNRNGSNLSRETLLTSLRMTYGYDGGQELLDHIAEYFDTPQHAAFAIQLATNPRRQGDGHSQGLERIAKFSGGPAKTYTHIKQLLDEHSSLLESDQGASLAMLAMRTALRMGDPAGARKIAGDVPENAAIRRDPDFQWMSASAGFLSHDYAAAEPPLLALFGSDRASVDQKYAAAYGLCGVYWKLGERQEQLRFALWLYSSNRKNEYAMIPSLADLSIYWASSNWDLAMLLETEAPIDDLRNFVRQNPDVEDIRVVKYSLAVRLSREHRYGEAADIYAAINAHRRVPRIRELASLYAEVNRPDLTEQRRLEAKYNMAEFLAANPDRIYFNDAVWHGYQRYAMQASTDSRLTRAEREAMIAAERKLKDEQEERWRAYQLFREIVRDAGKTELGRRAAVRAMQCLAAISDRFGRQTEIRTDEKELAMWLKR